MCGDNDIDVNKIIYISSISYSDCGTSVGVTILVALKIDFVCTEDKETSH